MFDKIKELGNQVADKASSAVDGISTSVKGGVDSLTTSVKSGVDSVTTAAVSVGDALNEKAVSSSTAQACTIIELAIKELKTRPLSQRPMTLTAKVDFQLAALGIQVHLTPEDFADGAAPAALPKAG